jgi:hypothetical protein
VAFPEFGEEVIARMLEFGKPLSDRVFNYLRVADGPLGLTQIDFCRCQLSVLSTLLTWRDTCNLVANGTFRTPALIPRMSAIGVNREMISGRPALSVGHVLVAGMSPPSQRLRPSGYDRCRIMRLSFRNPPLPGPRFCPESALRRAP